MLESFIPLQIIVGFVLFSANPRNVGLQWYLMQELTCSDTARDLIENMHGLRNFDAWIEKDHFPMPFMNQMLDRIDGKG